MRGLLLIGCIVCCFFHFYSEKVDTPHSDALDSLTTKQSSIKQIAPEKRRPSTVRHSVPEKQVTETLVARNEEESSEEGDSYAAVEEDVNVPWSEIEDGWKTELKNFLVSTDPEHGEEIYSAYLEEKRKFAEKINYGDESTSASESAEDETPVFESDAQSAELEKNHRDNLKDIFGNHYDQVKSLHEEYVESIQYINRSEIKFSISL